MDKKNNVIVKSFGCRLNSLEGEIIKSHITTNIDFDILVINSCAVTNEAERQQMQFIRKEKKNNPEAKIVVTGCASELDREKYLSMPEVDYVIPSVAKLDESIWENLDSLDTYAQDMKYMLPPIIDNFEDKQRAFVQIQNGCDHECTYCATRLARGKSISFPKDHIIKQINKLVDKYNEIVITGVDISSYNYEGLNLKSLVKEILDKTSIPRIRFSSLDIADIDDDFIDLITSEPRIMPHFHFSLQSGDNMILKRMRRRHTREDVFYVIDKIMKQKPNATFGADIITGFPTETEEMFNNSVDMVKKANIAFLHVFPYSEKINTAATKMPQIDVAIRKQRAKELREVGNEVMSKVMNSKIGTKTTALIEGGFIARADDYSRIVFDGYDVKVGSIQDIKIIDVNAQNMLRGEICSKN